MKQYCIGAIILFLGIVIGYYMALQRERGWKNGEYGVIYKAANILIEVHKNKNEDKIKKIDDIIHEYQGLENGWKVCKSISEINDL